MNGSFYRIAARRGKNGKCRQAKGCGGLARGRKKRDGPKKILSSIFQMPPPELYTGAMLHINCNGSVQVDNSKGIVLYNENAVELDMGKTRVRLSGDDLTLETVEKGIVLVRGRIFNLEFFYSAREDKKRQG